MLIPGLVSACSDSIDIDFDIDYSGPTVTASGLIFIASSTDEYLRAFSIETGEELWKGRLPTGGHATPMTYGGARTRNKTSSLPRGATSAWPSMGRCPAITLSRWPCRTRICY
ncbi:MAG: hypothetical protein ACE1Y4_13755 [Lysobacterales bacterium]